MPSKSEYVQIWYELSDIKIQLVIMWKPYWHVLTLWMNYLEQIHDNFDQFWDTLGPLWGDSDLFSKDNSDLKWMSERLLWIVAKWEIVVNCCQVRDCCELLPSERLLRIVAKVTIFSAISQWEQDTFQWRWCPLCTRHMLS
jgi:hypothetical protein